MRYADPSVCPGCRATLGYGAATCASCDLPVRNGLAVELFATLHHADQLVARLRAATPTPPATPPRPTPVTPPSPTASPPPPPPAPVPVPPAARRTGVRFATVPKILLGLGALCLLVAAITFLALSWSMLGVGGRTLVLAVLTVAAGGGALLLHHFRLRIAAEAMAAVTSGLIALDVLGAEAAGWFGTIGGSTLAIVVGLVLTGTGTGFAMLTRPRLGAPQVAAAIGALTAATASALQALDEPTWRALWSAGDGWLMLLAAAALVLPGAVLGHRTALLTGAAGAAVLTTFALTLPAADGPIGLLTLVALVTTAAWTGVVALLPRPLRVVAIAPAATGSLLLAALTAMTALTALARWGSLGMPLDRDVDVVISGPDPATQPLVAVPAVLLITALLAVSLPSARPATWLRYGGLAAGLAALTTLACYDIALLAVTSTAVALAIAAAALSHTATSGTHRTGFGVLALLIGGLAVLSAAPSATLTALAAAAFLALSGVLHLLSRSAGVAGLSGVAMAPALAVAIWAGAAALDVGWSWTGVPVLIAVGALAISRPRLEVEWPAVVTAFTALLVAVPAAADRGGSLALHLTVAGCLCGATALIHPSRRQLIWPGACLLLLASWVRLADLEVTAPEPYTLPLAIALLGTGLWHLQRHPQADTASALLPGLLMATAPSLMWVLDDPYSVRALVLGAGCLALTVAGAALRWSAPLTVGATVGAIVVLRELAPYAGAWPQWVWIGLAGALLTVVGITWERRLLEVRQALGYLGRLR